MEVLKQAMEDLRRWQRRQQHKQSGGEQQSDDGTHEERYLRQKTSFQSCNLRVRLMSQSG